MRVVKIMVVSFAIFTTGCATKIISTPDNATIDPKIMAECDTKAIMKSSLEEDVLQYITESRRLLKVCAELNKAKKAIIEKAFSK